MLLRSLIRCFLFVSLSSACYGGYAAQPHFGQGVKIGEVTDSSAIVWVRLCESDRCDENFRLPGTAGEVRVCYRVAGSAQRVISPWQSVGEELDFTAKVKLAKLPAASKCEFVVEARNAAGATSFEGSFRTAPALDDENSDVVFTVTTGHKWKTIDDLPNGHLIYPSMLKLEPGFLFILAISSTTTMTRHRWRLTFRWRDCIGIGCTICQISGRFIVEYRPISSRMITMC